MRERTTQVRYRWLLLICSLLFVWTPHVFAWSYHSFTYGYSISLPEDWAQVPEEVVASKFDEIPSLGLPGARADVVFQPKRPGQGIDYPYIVVDVVPYSKLGYPQQVNDSEIHQIVKNNTGLDPANPYTADTQVVEGGGELETLDGTLNFDAANRRFTYSTTSSHSDIGLVRTRQWGFFGKDILVQVTLYERGKGSDRLRDMARAVSGSFKFEIGREYQPAFTLGDVLQMAGQLVAAPNLGVVVTLGCVLTGVVFAVIALTSNRRHLASNQQYSVFERERGS